MVSLCNAPSNGLLTRRATEALGLIKAISPWFSEHIPTAIDKQVEKMESLLEGRKLSDFWILYNFYTAYFFHIHVLRRLATIFEKIKFMKNGETCF